MKMNISMMQCDNPECDVRREDSDSEPALGIYLGTGSVHEGYGGGPFAKAYACSWDCVGPAVKAVFNEAYDAGRIRKKW